MYRTSGNSLAKRTEPETDNDDRKCKPKSVKYLLFWAKKNDTHVIDAYARSLFPLCFFIFCIVYFAVFSFGGINEFTLPDGVKVV